MNIKKLANALLVGGILMMAAALAWWFHFYQPIANQLGIKLSRAGNCLYSMDGPCRMAHGIATLVGDTPYSPYAFWAAVAMLAAGILLRAGSAK